MNVLSGCLQLVDNQAGFQTIGIRTLTGLGLVWLIGIRTQAPPFISPATVSLNEFKVMSPPILEVFFYYRITYHIAAIVVRKDEMEGTNDVS